MIKVDEAYYQKLKKRKVVKPRISSLYSMDRIFKIIFKIPKFIPVSKIAILEHGANFQFSFFYERLLKSENELIFFDNTERVNKYFQQTQKTSYAIGPLYPKYRKLKNYNPLPDRQGTLAFPSHSTSQYDFSLGYKKYINDLHNLPDRFHPIRICMYYYDILKGHHKIFSDAGFEVVTNGSIDDPYFIDNLYSSLIRHKYVTSNHMGSYAFYALEAGIPFFLYGDDIKDELIKLQTINGVKMSDFVEENFLNYATQQMYFDLSKDVTITPEQQTIVRKIMGESNILTHDEVKRLVLKNWIPLLIKKAKKLLTKN